MSLGLGEFAIFLEGDALAVATKTRASDQAHQDELKKQNEDAKYMTKYTRDLEKFTPTKEKPKWVFGRPKFPRIKRRPMAHAEGLPNRGRGGGGHFGCRKCAVDDGRAASSESRAARIKVCALCSFGDDPT